MKRSVLRRLALAVPVLLFVGAAQAAPRWFARTGLDFWNLPALQRDLTAREQASAELEANRQAVMRVKQMKCAVAADVVAGRLSLREAAARFEELNGDGVKLLQSSYHCGSALEAHCLNVVKLAEVILEGLPASEAEAVRARLRREYAELVGAQAPTGRAAGRPYQRTGVAAAARTAASRISTQ